jgi:hypothetical protein
VTTHASPLRPYLRGDTAPFVLVKFE